MGDEAPRTQTIAAPPRFHFSLRLITEPLRDAELEGRAPPANPYAGAAWRLRWGGETHEGTVGADGVVTADVPGEATSGTLELGERDGAAFRSRLRIPVQSQPPSAAEGPRREAAELGWRMRNLGMAETTDASAVFDGLMRFQFRRRLVGTEAQLREAARRYPRWDRFHAASLSASLDEIQRLHDRRGPA